ncbi:putative hemolysin [Rhodovulum bhavnagarense]|uniref:Putative hemolysin n=2 Tax=Rhodovulum bhavnagarense TaxID=992286 RepID=A0A4R2R697_9RHOB|nr:putative hemolysin [Rhodovulum bhavnagarense]
MRKTPDAPAALAGYNCAVILRVMGCICLDPFMFLEIVLVLLLIGVNGLLAMSELAVVSSRPARLRARAERGDRGAGIALDLAEDPGKFLSTVQIGITLVGVLAGAFSGATIGLRLAEALPQFGVPEAAATEVGVGLVVVVITYLSLIAGELVPKQIALAAPERVASAVAPAMLLLSRIAAPVVWLLDRSGKLVLRLVGQSGRRETSISDEDIRSMLSEAAGAGVIHRAEKELIGGVMRFSDRRARGLMTPRHDVEIALLSETRADILARFQASGHSRLPLRRDGPDDIVGVLHSRDLLATSDDSFDALALMRPAPVIQERLPALDVIDRLRNSPCHMLLVYNEYGHFKGIVTPMDVLGTIAGGFDEPGFAERGDGSLFVAGWVPVDELEDRLGLTIRSRRAAETVAGLVLERLGEVPGCGQSVVVGGWRMEIVDMDGLRIKKLIVQRNKSA